MAIIIIIIIMAIIINGYYYYISVLIIWHALEFEILVSIILSNTVFNSSEGNSGGRELNRGVLGAGGPSCP